MAPVGALRSNESHMLIPFIVTPGTILWPVRLWGPEGKEQALPRQPAGRNIPF